MRNDHRMELFACRASRDFAAKVVDELNNIRYPGEELLHLGSSEVTMFSDGEFQPAFTESVRGATVFIVGTIGTGTKIKFNSIATTATSSHLARQIQILITSIGKEDTFAIFPVRMYFR